MVVKAFAPAKVNLSLHVTGQRADGYHELDSLVMFADIGDRIEVALSDSPSLTVDGEMAAGVPTDASNLVMKAQRLMGVSASIRLHKRLPNAAGLGGGSSDAAAVIRALSQLAGVPVPEDVLSLGADIPVCLAGQAVRMRGAGEQITPMAGLPALHAVLINPNVPVPTADVFARLKHKDNAAMPDDIPNGITAAEFALWLRDMRNDLEPPAIIAQPVIAQVIGAFSVTPGCQLARMTGSGATCFGLYGDAETASSAEGRLREAFPGWWVAATRLNAAA